MEKASRRLGRRFSLPEPTAWITMALVRKEKSPLAFACGHVPPHIYCGYALKRDNIQIYDESVNSKCEMQL